MYGGATNNTNINVNNIRLIYEKLNEFKWNAFLKKKNGYYMSKEIKWKVLK